MNNEKIRLEYPATFSETFEWHLPQRDFVSIQAEEIFTKQRKNLESRIEYALRHFVYPPIKGEITRGKLRWRGIKLCIIKDDKSGLIITSRLHPDGISLESAGRIVDSKDVVQCTYSETYTLMQRECIIPLNFDGDVEEQYQLWLKERS